MNTTISNSSPLIAFMKKREVTLLRSLFGSIIIPPAVLQELTEGGNELLLEKQTLENCVKEGWISVKPVPKTTLPPLPLGMGEAEAINLSLTEQPCLLLMDEKKGRNIAQAIHIPVLGTLGILKLALLRRLKTREEIAQNIDILLKGKFYLSSELILRFLEDIRHVET